MVMMMALLYESMSDLHLLSIYAGDTHMGEVIYCIGICRWCWYISGSHVVGYTVSHFIASMNLKPNIFSRSNRFSWRGKGSDTCVETRWQNRIAHQPRILIRHQRRLCTIASKPPIGSFHTNRSDEFESTPLSFPRVEAILCILGTKQLIARSQFIQPAFQPYRQGFWNRLHVLHLDSLKVQQFSCCIDIFI